MADVKWIKLTTNMFDNRKIKHIRKLPEGNNIVLIWVMLLTMAGRCNSGGFIFLTENVPYTTKMLADELGFEESVIQIALSALEKFDMIYRDGDLLSIPGWEEHQNAEGLEKVREQTRRRVSEYREKQKAKALELQQQQEDDSKAEEGEEESGGFKKTAKNVTNLKAVINNHPESCYITENPELYQCVETWMAYKDDKKPKVANHYDSERGILSLLTRFIEHDKTYGTEAIISIVNESICNNYQGILWDNLQKKSFSRKNKFDEWRNA